MNIMLKKSKKISLARVLLSGIVSWSLTFSSFPLYAVETDPSKIVTERKPGKPPVRTTGDKGDDSKMPTDVIPSSLGDIQALIIPEAFGTIKELFRGSKEGAFIFHIQDVHVNMEVQENIAKIVDQVNRTYFDEQVSVVAVEGAKGDVDLGLLRALPDEFVRNETSRYLMRQGLLTGPEYYGVQYQQQARVFGIEDGLLYFDNLSAFRDSIQTSQKTSKAVQQFQRALDVLTANLATPELKDFYAKQLAYEANELPLSQYVKYLQKLSTGIGARIEVHPNIKRVMQAIALEGKINFQRLEGEQLQLIGELQQKGTQGQIAALIQKSLDFRTGRLPSDKYYQYLIETARSQKIDVKENYMEVFSYAQLVRLQTQINPSILFKEIEWAEREVKEKIFVSNAEKKVDQIREDLQILLALQNLTLSRDQWHYFEDHQTEFNLRDWRNIVETEGNKLGLALNIPREWDRLMPQFASAKRFYDAAIKRDQAIVKNLFAELKKRNQKVAFLVTGGFHTKGITQQMKAKDISYAVITPRMTQKHDNALYRSLMMGGITAALAPPANWPNELALEVTIAGPEFIGVSAANLEFFRKELASNIEQTVLATVGAAVDKSINVRELQETLQEFDIVIARLTDNVATIEYTDQRGERSKVIVRNVATEPGKVDLKFSLPEPAGPAGPAAFQGGVSPIVRADVGNLPEGVLSVGRDNIEVRAENPNEGTQRIRDVVEADSQRIGIGAVEVRVDNRLLTESKLSSEEFEGLLNAAIKADPRGEAILRGIQEQLQARGQTNVVLALLDNAENLFEDHLGNGFIGVNRGLLSALSRGIVSRDLFETILQVGFLHELRHESAPRKEQERGPKLNAFEDRQVPQDVALFFALARARGIDINEETLTALAAVFNRESPFVRALGRVATTRLASKDPARSKLAGDFSTALLNPDALPNESDVGIVGGLGVFEAARVAVNPPTILLDLKKLQEQPERFLSDIDKYLRAGIPLRIVITDVEVRTSPELIATFNRFVPANVRQQVEIETVQRVPEITNREYAKQIAIAVEEYQNIRIFTDRWEFYSLVEQALAFVQTLFRDTGEVTIVMTKAEYERVRKVLESLGGEAAKILNVNNLEVDESKGLYILKLPAQILADEKYLNAIEQARRILATQA